MRYRRIYIRGGCYFFTVVTEQRQPIFSDATQVEILREAFKRVKQNYAFTIDAMVALPDHLHCIWTLPESDNNYAIRWRLVKTWFTKHCNQDLRLVQNQTKARRQEQALWQHRYWEHAIRDEDDFQHHVEYIHYNPVKHGYVASAVDWPYSSLQRYIKNGSVPADWGSSMIEIPDGIGHE